MVLATVTALGDLWSHQLMLSPMPVSPFYDKVVLAVHGWVFCCGSPLALYVFCCDLETRSPVVLVSRSLGMDREYLIEVQRTPPPTSKQECDGRFCLSYVRYVLSPICRKCAYIGSVVQ